MKKFFCLFALSAFVFTACNDKDEDNGGGNGGGNGSDAIRKISLKSTEISNLPSDGIKEVQAVVYPGSHTIATAKWDNGFELELPATVPTAYLIPVKDAFGGYVTDASGEVTYSTDANVASVDLEAIGENSNADIFYGKIISDEQSVYVEYTYSDKDCTVKGTLTWDDGEKDTFNLSLKKGWNRVAITYTENDNIDETAFSTTIPSGLSWRYGEF